MSETKSLQDKLTAMRESAKERIPAEWREVMERATTDLVASGLAERARGKGDPLPPFELEDTEGHLVSSRDLLDRGPLVVTWYRGVW